MDNTKKQELSKGDTYDILDKINCLLQNRYLLPKQKENLERLFEYAKTLHYSISSLECNCAKCVHPWRKEANEVYCYAKDDEYYEHALVITNPELHTCSNYKAGRKTKHYCSYKYKCSMKENGKCMNKYQCNCQVKEPKEEK